MDMKRKLTMASVVKESMLVIMLLEVFCIYPTYCDYRRNFDDHRIKLLEQSVRTYVFETQPEIARLDTELKDVMEENKHLKIQLQEQQETIRNLQWASYDMQSRTLTREERDMVTQLKWTIFDLKAANEELQEDACLRTSECQEWTQWSECSVTCGAGTIIRSRTCETAGKFNSMCKPQLVEEKTCNDGACEPVSTFPQLDCQDGYESYQGYCFKFSGRQDTRLLASILCEDEGAHLVSVDDKNKQKVVFDYLSAVAPKHMPDLDDDFSKREYWDFKDLATKTDVAIDGIRKHQLDYFLNWRSQKMTHFNWAKGQPRNDRSDGDYCLTMNVRTGEWFLNCCQMTFFYVCETERRVTGRTTGNRDHTIGFTRSWGQK